MRRTSGSVVILVLAGVLAPACASPSAAAEPHVVRLVGSRTIAETGRPLRGPAPGSYPVTETDSAGGVRWLVYGAPAVLPDHGIQLVTESITSSISSPYGTPVESPSTDTTTGIDRGAHQVYTVNDVRTVTTTVFGTVGRVEHFVEDDRGTNGVTMYSADFTRTTGEDGTFEESGSIATAEQHSLRVRLDFSATSHDQIPGFSLIDRTLSAPVSGTGAPTISVTTASQGRTIGNVPIITRTVIAPLWFPLQNAPTIVDHTVTSNGPLPRQCGTAASKKANVAVREHRRQIDPTRTITETAHDVYYDADQTAICRIDRVETTYGDVVTGEVIGTRVDVTVLARR